MRIYQDNGPPLEAAHQDDRVKEASAEVRGTYRKLAAAGYASRDIVAYLQEEVFAAGCKDRAMRHRGGSGR